MMLRAAAGLHFVYEIGEVDLARHAEEELAVVGLCLRRAEHVEQHVGALGGLGRFLGRCIGGRFDSGITGSRGDPVGVAAGAGGADPQGTARASGSARGAPPRRRSRRVRWTSS